MRMGRLLGNQEVACRRLSVWLSSITCQSYFGSAELGIRFMQCAKRKDILYKVKTYTNTTLEKKMMIALNIF